MTETGVSLRATRSALETLTIREFGSALRTEDVQRRLGELRQKLLTSEYTRPLEANDPTLAAFSLWCAELRSICQPSIRALDEAGVAFKALAQSPPVEDQFGEVLETLCTLAFTAWRHARALGRTRESQEWLERFDRLFAQPSIARECLEYFLATPALERSADLNDAFLLKSDELFFVCSILRKRCNASPAVLADEVRALHDWVDQRFWPCNFVDEREYFLAQMEHVAASCARWLGDREACLSWVRAAEGRYDRTVEPESGRAELMMLRLAVLYERHDLVEALSGIPELQARLRALGMMRALAKCEILLSAVLKDLGRVSESTVILEAALKTEVLTQVPDLRAFALEQLADCHGLSGRFEECAACLRSAAALLEGSLGTTAGGYGKIILGEALVVRGDLEGAVAAYRTGREDFEGLGMMGWSAYSRVLTAEVLLALRREGEAQQEILLAMPAIERHQMVPEGLAAVALLRESIRRRRTDRNALRELREHLRGKR